MSRESTTGMIYVGTFHRTMDAKNRVTVALGMDGEEGEVLYMLPAQSGSYLNVMPAAEFAQQEETLRASVPAADGARSCARFSHPPGASSPTSRDASSFPTIFCKEAGLSANITFAGVKKSFEVWDRRNGRAVRNRRRNSAKKAARRWRRLAISGGNDGELHRMRGRGA